MTMSKKRHPRHSFPQKNLRTQKTQDQPNVVYLTEYEITWEPILDERYKQPPHVVEAIERLHDMTRERPREAIPELKRLIQENPNVPTLYNYLCVAYSMIGQAKDTEDMILKTYHQFPDYLFAQLSYAELCLSKGDLKQIPIIFNNKFDLKLLYPQRKVFHISEATGFMSLMGEYCAMKGERESAMKYYELLNQLVPDHPKVKQLRAMLFPGILSRLARFARQR